MYNIFFLQGLGDDSAVKIDANDEMYWQHIIAIPHVLSLNLSWSLTKQNQENDVIDVFDKNMSSTYPLVNKYHNWSLTELSCKSRKDARTNQPEHGNIKAPTRRSGSPPEVAITPWQPSYLHVIPSALVHVDGRIRVRNAQLTRNGCADDVTQRRRQETLRTKLHKPRLHEQEVFVTSHQWATRDVNVGVLHDAGQLVPYLDFLKAYTNVKIHVFIAKGDSGLARRAVYHRYLKLLGLDASRMITGSINAKIAYVPKVDDCKTLPQPNGQMLSHLLRQSIRASDPGSRWSTHPNTIVFVRQRHSEQYFNTMHTALRDVATRYNLKLEVISVKNAAMERSNLLVFYKAVMIVSADGAGLSNMLLSRPGTCIVEIIPEYAPTSYYQTLAYFLGYIYHGLLVPAACNDFMQHDVTRVINECLKTAMRHR